MRTIYEKANEVAIWLGGGHDDAHLAFTFLKRVLEREDAGGWTQNILLNPELIYFSQALVMVLIRDYWDRVWIVQEVVSAREKTIYCGSESASWNDLREALKLILDQCRSVGTSRVTFPAFARVAISLGPLDLEKYWKLSEQGVPGLFSALRLFRNKVSSDPRDKVYGIIGFMVDYSLTVFEVYINIVKYFVTTSQSLDINGVEKGQLHPDWLPSWAPDWSYMDYNDNVSQQDQTSAALSKPADTLFDSFGRVLPVRGIITGVIKSATISVDKDRERILASEKLSFHQGYESNDFHFLLLAICDWHALAVRDASYETICSKSRTVGIKEREAHFEVFAAAICHYMPNYPMNGLLGDAFLRLQDKVKYEDLPRILGLGDAILTNIAGNMYGRRFFVSSEGRMGLAPPSRPLYCNRQRTCAGSDE